MGLRMAGTALAVALTVAAIFVFASPRPVVGAPKGPTLVVTERRGFVQQNVGPGFEGANDVSCLPGETVVGGGFLWGEYDATVDDFAVLTTQHAEVDRSVAYGPLSWRVAIVNTSASATIDIRATVMCAKIQ